MKTGHVASYLPVRETDKYFLDFGCDFFVAVVCLFLFGFFGGVVWLFGLVGCWFGVFVNIVLHISMYL